MCVSEAMMSMKTTPAAILLTTDEAPTKKGGRRSGWQNGGKEKNLMNVGALRCKFLGGNMVHKHKLMLVALCN